MLGHAEAPILAFEGTTEALIKGNDKSENGIILTTQCVAISTLWIFGFYELLRKMRANKSVGFELIENIYRDVATIRMPLAKHEVLSAPGYRNRSHYPTGIYNSDSGSVGWRVFDPKENCFIDVFRKELADAFLDVSAEK